MMKYTATLKLKCDHPSGHRLHIAGRMGLAFGSIGRAFGSIGKRAAQGKDLTQAKLLDLARKDGWRAHQNGTHSCPDCVKAKMGIPRHPASPNKPTPVAPPMATRTNSLSPDPATCSEDQSKQYPGAVLGDPPPDFKCVVPDLTHNWSDAPINATHWSSETNIYYHKTQYGDVLVHNGHTWSPSSVTFLDLDDVVFIKRPGVTTELHAPGIVT